MLLIFRWQSKSSHVWFNPRCAKCSVRCISRLRRHSRIGYFIFLEAEPLSSYCFHYALEAGVKAKYSSNKKNLHQSICHRNVHFYYIFQDLIRNFTIELYNASIERTDFWKKLIRSETQLAILGIWDDAKPLMDVFLNDIK